jgi:hypothetical protein
LQGVLVVKQNHRHALQMETELFLETLEKLQILTRLSAPEIFMEFCPSESFKNYSNYFRLLSKKSFCNSPDPSSGVSTPALWYLALRNLINR